MFKLIAPTVVVIFLASSAFSDTTITVPYKKTIIYSFYYKPYYRTLS